MKVSPSIGGVLAVLAVIILASVVELSIIANERSIGMKARRPSARRFREDAEDRRCCERRTSKTKEKAMKNLDRFSNHAYALLRIVAGFMFTWHGVQKIFGVLTEHQPAVGSQLWFGGLIELVCGILIMIGFQTRWAAFLASGTMAVAYFQFHWKFQFTAAILPVVNQGELAALYSFVFLLIACRGGVKWCIDAVD
jgi:putative oxidoreductase